MKPLFPDITVNGETIAPAAIAAEAQNHKAPAGKPGLAWRAAARAMVVRALLLQEARRLGMAADPRSVADDKWETDDEALIRALLEQEIEPREVSEAACQALYESRTETFRSPSLFQPAHILFAARPADKKARQAARQNAKAALATLQGDPKAFARIAKANSDCPSRDNGGSLGQVGSGDTVAEFEAVLQTLPAGQLHPEPVETRFGFHVIRMDERAEGAQLPFDAVKTRIREKLEQVAWAKAAKALTQKLVDQAAIEGIDLGEPIGVLSDGFRVIDSHEGDSPGASRGLETPPMITGGRRGRHGAGCGSSERGGAAGGCQSAFKRDPRSASNFDPLCTG